MTIHPIENLGAYAECMKKSIIDKSFFLDKVFGVDTVLDYGCGNGELLRFIHSVRPDLRLIGYDNNPYMIDLARGSSDPAIEFTSDLDLAAFDESTTVLNFSSVLHEICTYCSWREILKVQEIMREWGFKYVTVRDMFRLDCYPTKYLHCREIRDAAIEKGYADKVEAFEKRWGRLTDSGETTTHFVLKYRWKENWERELNEDYMALSVGEIMNFMGYEDEYNHEDYICTYHNSYCLPFVSHTVKKDLGVNFTTPTHAQLIFEGV